MSDAKVIRIVSDPWGIRIEHAGMTYDITHCPGEKGVVLKEAAGKEVPEEVEALALEAFTESAMLAEGHPTARSAGKAHVELLKQAPRRFNGKSKVVLQTPAGVSARLNEPTD